MKSGVSIRVRFVRYYLRLYLEDLLDYVGYLLSRREMPHKKSLVKIGHKIKAAKPLHTCEVFCK